MDKKGICKSITPEKEYEYNSVMNYPWTVTFDNGDKGKITTRSNQPPYEVNKEYPYTIEEKTDKNGNKWNKVGKLDPTAKKFADPKIKLRSFAMKYATRMVSAGIIERVTPPVEDESNDSWNAFTARVQKSCQLYYKLMMDDTFKYGNENIDSIGTAMSQAIDLVCEGKIHKNKMVLYYTKLLESILVIKPVNPTPAQ